MDLYRMRPDGSGLFQITNTPDWQEGGSVTPRKVDNIVKKLRSKVEEDPSNPQHILTVHGKGYRFEP